jgi:hypothetical protein
VKQGEALSIGMAGYRFSQALYMKSAFILSFKKERIQKMKKTLISTISLILTLVFMLSLFSCAPKKEAELWDDAVYKESVTLGEGEKTLTVELKVNEHLITFTLKTDKATVGEALIENELVSGDEGPYGLYVKVVNGMTADYDIDQSYWAFYINGEFAMTGIDMTEIKEGEIYRLEYAH